MTDAVLTREYLQKHDVSFRPASVEEARHLQGKLIAMGCRWRQSGAVIKYLEETVEEGIQVQHGTMTRGAGKNVLPCSRLGPLSAEDALSDRELMLERFKQVSARQDRLEELLNRLLEAVEPKALPKDSMLPAARKKRAP